MGALRLGRVLGFLFGGCVGGVFGVSPFGVLGVIDLRNGGHWKIGWELGWPTFQLEIFDGILVSFAKKRLVLTVGWRGRGE